MPDEGLPSLESVFNDVLSESDLGESLVSETALPAVEEEDGGIVEQPPVEVVDDPQVDGEGTEELDLSGLEDLLTESEESAPVDTSSPEFLATQVTIDTVAGPETLTIEELSKGYLRQADYTQKTQAVAEQRRAVSDAVQFLEQFQESPEEFARTLAVRAGLIEEGASPVKNIELAKIPTPDEVEAMVEERLQERLAKDPSVQEAKLTAARAKIEGEFAAIEKEFHTSLSDEVKAGILREAANSGAPIRLTFEALLGRQRAKQPRDVKRASAARPTGGAGPTDKGESEKAPQSVREAMDQALAELGA